ncbi:hypothetical protein ABFV83_02220 [Lacrimispora sp. BS-2]|uniref:Uncharacterized protein n=1 Tax=Lacrimispora sp. BS-2 TaxID=3151850 RepID=A0AAU7PSU6_9FIRM
MLKPILIELEMKTINGVANPQLTPNLPIVEGLGNLSLKHFKLIQRIIRINKKAKESFDIWEQIQKTKLVPQDYFLISEELIFHMRRAVDDMISLVWVLEENKKTPGLKMDKLIVKDIGNYLNLIKSDTNEFKAFNDHEEFLNLLNDFANSFKHSFVDSDQSRIGLNEPCIFTLYMKGHLVDEDNYKFHGVSQNSLMDSFNSFFKTYQKHIK